MDRFGSALVIIVFWGGVISILGMAFGIPGVIDAVAFLFAVTLFGGLAAAFAYDAAKAIWREREQDTAIGRCINRAALALSPKLRRRLRERFDGVVRSYSAIEPTEVPAYQSAFGRICRKIDIDVLTAWSHGENVDREALVKNRDDIRRMVRRSAQRNGMVPELLEAIVFQFIFADMTDRDWERESWVDRVMHRKREDFFPTCEAASAAARHLDAI